MKTGRIPVITRRWPALVVALGLLLSAGPAWGKDAPTLDEQLIGAAKSGDLAAVKTLLAKGADVNAKDGDGLTALIAAAGEGQLEVVRLLLNKGADANKDHGGRDTTDGRCL